MKFENELKENKLIPYGITLIIYMAAIVGNAGLENLVTVFSILLAIFSYSAFSEREGSLEITKNLYISSLLSLAIAVYCGWVLVSVSWIFIIASLIYADKKFMRKENEKS